MIFTLLCLMNAYQFFFIIHTIKLIFKVHYATDFEFWSAFRKVVCKNHFSCTTHMSTHMILYACICMTAYEFSGWSERPCGWWMSSWIPVETLWLLRPWWVADYYYDAVFPFAFNRHFHFRMSFLITYPKFFFFPHF